MARRKTEEPLKLSRRDFLITTGGALAGMAPSALSIARQLARGIRNGAAPCTMAQAAMRPASTRIRIIRTTSLFPPP